MINLRSPNIVLIILLSFISISILYLVVNENGILKSIKLQNEISKLQAEIEKVEKEKKMLELEIDSLEKKFPAKIEKVAREKYGMTRKNEVKIKIETQ